MKKESGVCRMCPIKLICNPNLRPEPDRRGGEFSNPWNCRHNTCVVGAAHARMAGVDGVQDTDGKIRFDSPQKQGLTRRFDLVTGIIESLQDDVWHKTGQVIPEKRLRT